MKIYIVSLVDEYGSYPEMAFTSLFAAEEFKARLIEIYDKIFVLWMKSGEEDNPDEE